KRSDSQSVIYLALLLLTRSNGLPVSILPMVKRASNSRIETYLTFQLSGFAAIHVTIYCRELLPLVFTLILPGKTVYFLWHFPSTLMGRLPVRKRDALCCPDFPP